MSQSHRPQESALDASGELQQRALWVVLPASVLLGLAITPAAKALGWPLRVSAFGSLLTVFPFVALALQPLQHPAVRWGIALGYLGIGFLAIRWLALPIGVCLLPTSVGLAGCAREAIPALLPQLEGYGRFSCGAHWAVRRRPGASSSLPGPS